MTKMLCKLPIVMGKTEIRNKTGTCVFCISINIVAPQFSSSCEVREKKKKIEENPMDKNSFHSRCPSVHSDI